MNAAAQTLLSGGIFFYPLQCLNFQPGHSTLWVKQKHAAPALQSSCYPRQQGYGWISILENQYNLFHFKHFLCNNNKKAGLQTGTPMVKGRGIAIKKRIRSAFLKILLSRRYKNFIKFGTAGHMQSKAYLFHEGEPAQRCYLVAKGCLKLSKLNLQGREVIIRYISSGEMTATPIVLRGGVYPVTAQAIKETEVISWDRSGFLKIAREHPEITLDLITLLFERMEDLQQRYLDLCSEQAPRRIAKFMISLMASTGRKKRMEFISICP